ncbi:hypothetical protein [uncultured Bilophila sp.]|uniref:hypothetical protein n=1 Tax=uncultured Bilophila sp. TaxID=529385 RepID=UPI00266FFD56|nr:hypothetical protein [uncultured Bilophila sp.]
MDRLHEHTCAKLILINLSLYGEEKGKDVSRARLSKATLKAISKRKHIKQGFISTLFDELLELGWFLGDQGEDEYFLLRLNKVQSWTRVASSRVKPLLAAKNREKIESDVEKKYVELFGEDQMEEPDE